MFLALLLLLIFAATAIDWWSWRRISRTELAIGPRRVANLLLLLTDALPLLLMGVSWLLPDNTTAVMTVAMWCIWAWLATVVPRLIYYFMRWCRLPWLGVIGGCFFVGAMIWGTTVGRNTVRVSRVTVASPRLPAQFDGFRIAQISDWHIGTQVNPDREMTRLVDSINALHPDIVAFTGDLVNIRYTELDSAMMRRLRRIQAPVYAILGNHDTGVYIKDSLSLSVEENTRRLVALEEAIGWRVLQNEHAWLVRGGDTVTLTGITFDPALRELRHDPTVPSQNLDSLYGSLSREQYNITLVHLPQMWEQILATEYGDLTLSGHVHSMQMKVHCGSHVWSPARLMYKRWSGRYDAQGRTLYINDGVGYVGYPMRLGAPAEITLITLKRCE